MPRARDEVDFAVINGNYATDSGIELTEALFQEPSFAYVNWSAIKSADTGKKWVKDVTNAYNSESFKKYAHETFPGYKYPKIWGTDHSAHMETAAKLKVLTLQKLQKQLLSKTLGQKYLVLRCDD